VIADERQVVLFSMELEEVFSEVRARSVYPIEIVGDVPWDLELIVDPISLAVSLSGGGVVIRNAVLTCILCRLYLFPCHSRG
jgi:hypothetical protein